MGYALPFPQLVRVLPGFRTNHQQYQLGSWSLGFHASQNKQCRIWTATNLQEYQMTRFSPWFRSEQSGWLICYVHHRLHLIFTSAKPLFRNENMSFLKKMAQIHWFPTQKKICKWGYPYWMCVFLCWQVVVGGVVCVTPITSPIIPITPRLWPRHKDP